MGSSVVAIKYKGTTLQQQAIIISNLKIIKLFQDLLKRHSELFCKSNFKN